jgi:hypothetical protein
VTRSEIPQLEVVTAIPDAESEDFLAQLLFSQGWSIIHRAFDGQSLDSFMEKRGSELRTVVVYQSDFPGIDAELLEKYSAPTITFISLDSIEFSSHELMVAIRSKLRAPMLHTSNSEGIPSTPEFASLSHDEVSLHISANTLPKTIRRINRSGSSRRRERKVIAITGSSGAPGRTRFAVALSEEISRDSAVALINADIRSHSLTVGDELTHRKRIEILPLDRENRPTQIPEGEEIAIVDLGTLPGLDEAVTDRRWHGSLINNTLDCATHLIYLCKSTSTSVAELAQFLREYPLLLKRVPVTYICILTGHSRELREWESKFLTLTLGESRHVLREGQLDSVSESGLRGILRLGNPRRKEIAKIATSLR